MNKYRNFLVGVVSSLAASVVLLTVTSLATPALVIIGILAGSLAAAPGLILLALGWIGSTILFILTFRVYRRRKIKRTLDVATMIYVPDRTLQKLMSKGPHRLPDEQLEDVITSLLSAMCNVLASRLDPSMRGASFLVLQDDDPETFSLYAHINHHDPKTGPAVAQYLKRNDSFAGYVLESGKIQTIEDCFKAPAQKKWKDIPTNGNEPIYKGRAGAPVQVNIGGNLKNIGVVCFDVTKRWDLSAENRQILQLVADKIAFLWKTYRKIPQKKSS